MENHGDRHKGQNILYKDGRQTASARCQCIVAIVVLYEDPDPRKVSNFL